MKKYVNGKIVELTPDEISAMQLEVHKAKITEKSRPLTVVEVNAMLISQQVNSLAVDDNTALRMKSFYPTFDSIVGQTVKKGFKFTYGDKLWSVVQSELTIQAHYPPGAGTESLYIEICETHDGTFDDPIPYNGNMVLENEKYYIQDYVIYKCVRDSINPVYDSLNNLVDLYVNVEVIL